MKIYFENNNQIKLIIKIIFQDDFLWDEFSLEKTVDYFKEDKNWLVSACQHTNDNGKTFINQFYPRYHNKIHLGINTISSPSVLTIKNKNKILFDERLIWLMDVDYYKMCYDTFGEPIVLNEVTVVNRISKEQLSSNMPEKIKNIELNLMIKKQGE